MYVTEEQGVKVTHTELLKIGDTHVAIRDIPVGEDQDPMYRLSRISWDINASDSLTLKFLADHETLGDAVEHALRDRAPEVRPL